MTGGEYSDHNVLLRSTSSASEGDLESQSPRRTNTRSIKDLLKRLDRGFSGRRSERDQNSSSSPSSNRGVSDEVLGDSAPPEWAMLLVGCLLGLATGLCVAAFNRGVHVIHEWAWAGTPNDGAAWLRLQRLADTWHRILLIPVLGGVIVGMLHGLLEILDQITQSSSSQGQGFDLIAGIFPTVKATQAAITLGTGCSLGPEGPSVDIGKSCAYGCSMMMENNRERRIALIAAGAAAGIASELPLYLILGMLCGVVSVAFTRLVSWFTKGFQFLKEKFGLPDVVCPALGGLGAGVIALRYPGILYWGFTNVDEILHTGKTASAPGIGLLAQLVAAKVVATALCKGSGLVGGLYAPSLMIGAAVGAVFGGLAGELINSAIPGNAAIAQPQAYALVGMAATLASVCSVPLTSVLLLFELTKDYRILLPLMGAVGLAIWVPSVTDQPKETEVSEAKFASKGYSILSPVDEKNEGNVPRKSGEGNDLELLVIGSHNSRESFDEGLILEDLKVSQAMSNDYLKVSPSQTVKEALECMHDGQQNCVVVVDAEGYLEGILTYGDVKRSLFKSHGDSSNSDLSVTDQANTCLVSSICIRGISYRGQDCGLLTCYPDTDLATAKQLMEAKGIKQLPVVKRGGEFRRERKRRIIAILRYDSIEESIRSEVSRRKSVYQQSEEDNDKQIVTNGH
ncbi:chloride channel protein CLC-f-like isoform X3 [Nicotiana tomentosiformis]|uniref:chloride channel protein CLC-f-like isoform X3 n=1 Tax=Nicotiana tomentosiformis TaxID=4098 RepID=UPI0008790DEF|nr:chloride channel protein CLC-f-like isoform X3 [Nicotiana tomentosiformis]